MSGVSWGGSEELWWRTARLLQKKGHSIFVNYKWWPESAWHLKQIQENGGELFFRDPPPPGFWESKRRWLTSWGQGQSGSKRNSWVERTRPDIVLVTLGYHPDRVQVADECIAAKIPYAINVQSASNFFFIHGDCLDKYRCWYRNATRVFFVSEENRHKLETNLAMALPNSEIVDNPFNVDRDSHVDWPKPDGTLRLACVGRMHFQSKGQDLIVDVLRRPVWKDRKIEIYFYGHDQGNGRQLSDLIAQYGLGEHLKVAGFEKDVSKIWEKCHALLLPSRYEGAALVVVESMLCNRMAITTDTGRNRELIDDGLSGFIAPGATVDLLDQVLERAWNSRDRWQEMGELAGRQIRERYSEDPIAEFAKRLESLKDDCKFG